MNIHEIVRKIWKDQVASKLISTAITGAFVGLYILLSGLKWNTFVENPWLCIIGIISILAFGFFVYYILKYIILGEDGNTKNGKDDDILTEEIEEENVSIYSNLELLKEEVPLDNEEEIHRSYNWIDSYILFAKCIAQTFPGDRDVVWYNSFDSVRRLNLFFEKLRREEPYGDAVWWRRGSQGFSVKNAEILDVDKMFLGNNRFKISRMAVFVSPSNYKHFIYIEADAEPPTGLYPEGADSYVEEMKSRRGYLTEEYGEFEDKLISRQEYDDGASVHDGNVIQHNMQAILRVRYLTKVNFILTPKNSPYNNRKFEIGSIDLFNDALNSEESIHKLFEFIDTFQKIDMPGNKYM